MNATKKKPKVSNKKPISSLISTKKVKKAIVPKIKKSVKVGKKTFDSRSKAALYLLQTTELSQAEIARHLKISQPCVNQIAQTLKDSSTK
jgi:DNA-directed RNA polymerase specialized sigma subunit